MRPPRFSLFDLFVCVTSLAVAAGASRLVWQSIRKNLAPRPDVPIDETVVAWIGLQVAFGTAATLLIAYRLRRSTLPSPRNLGETNYFVLPIHGACWTASFTFITPTSNIVIVYVLIGLSCMWSLASFVDLVRARWKRRLSPHRLVGDLFALIFGYPMLIALVRAIVTITGRGWL